jgi:hypothetical protein
MKKIIAISGLIGSGKDTAANLLITKHSFTKIAFADSLKDAVAAIFSWDRSMLEGSTQESRAWRETVDDWWAQRLDIPHLTPRWVLQNMGTEVLRNHFHDDIWVASVERKIHTCGHSVVITDCRFPNEIAAIKRIGGTTARIYRGQDPQWLELAKSDMGEFRRQYPHVHASEYSSVNLEYDYYVNNNGTIVELHAQLREMLR